MKNRNIVVLGLVGAILVGSMLTAEATEDYPAKTITIIVPEVPRLGEPICCRGSSAKSISERSARPARHLRKPVSGSGVEKAIHAAPGRLHADVADRLAK